MPGPSSAIRFIREKSIRFITSRVRKRELGVTDPISRGFLTHCLRKPSRDCTVALRSLMLDAGSIVPAGPCALRGDSRDV